MSSSLSDQQRARGGPAKLVAALLVALAAVLAVPTELRPVAMPVVAGVLIAVGFLLALSQRSVTTPMTEIGTAFVAVVTIYLVVPLGIYVALGGTYTIVNDNRLVQLQPSPAEVAGVGWLYVAFLGAFAAVYLLVRGRAEPPRTNLGVVSRQRLAVMLALYLVFVLLLSIVQGPLASDSYEGGAAAVAALPLVIRQFLKLWEGWSVLLTLALRVWLFQDFARRKWIIAAWVAFDVGMLAFALGSRTMVAISLVSSVILYHLLVKPVPLRTALAGALAGLVGFLLLGVARAFGGFGGIGAVGQWSSGVGGEFESLFGNVIDLQHRLVSGEVGVLPFGFHFADILAPFPSQIIPFQKYDPAVWYANTFFPEAAERGAGFAFGVIAQGVVGLGWLELVIRGAVLGYAFASLHRYFSRHADKFWVVVLYVWMTVWCYQSFRNQSFILLTFIVQWFLPLVLVVEVGVKILRTSGTSGAASPHAAVPAAAEELR